MFLKNSLILILLCCFISLCTQAQKQDSLHIDTKGKITTSPVAPVTDTAKPYNPKKAIIRSAMLPGWGQVTNKRTWKIIPIYAALGTTGYLFFRNLNQYKTSKRAYANATDGNTANDNLIPEPYYSVRLQPDRIRTFRNSVRQNVDYSVLFFIIFWGLNVADAAVDAHLKTFDVSDNLALQFKPGYSEMANTTGLSLVLHIGK